MADTNLTIHRDGEPAERYQIPPHYTEVQIDGLDVLLDAAGQRQRRLLDGTIAAWYETFKRGGRQPIPVPPAEQATCTLLARAVLKADGVLEGPPLVIGGREFMVGDAVHVAAGPAADRVDLDNQHLPPPDVPGDVIAVDPAARHLLVDFPIHGRQLLAADSPAGRLLRHDYTVPAAEPEPAAPSPQLDLDIDPPAAEIA